MAPPITEEHGAAPSAKRVGHKRSRRSCRRSPFCPRLADRLQDGGNAPFLAPKSRTTLLPVLASAIAMRSDTVFLVGAGINVPMWDPVIAALNELHPAPWIETPEQANHWLAWWVYAQRLRAERMDRTDVTPEVRMKNDELAQEDLRLRRTIAKHLREASAGQGFRLRRRFVEIVGRHRWDAGNGVAYLSANWDRLPEIELALNVVHIHGDVDAPETIFLPTETSAERHRTCEAGEYIRRLTGTAWQLIRDTHQLCIYGLSLSALDAELLWILQVGLEAHTERTIRIHVFDLESQRRTLDWRVRMVCPPTIPIEFHAVDDNAPVTW